MKASRCPYPGDVAPPEEVAKWLYGELATRFEDMCRVAKETRTPYTDAPLFPRWVVERAAAEVRSRYTDEQWNDMWREALGLITSARTGDAAAQAEVVSRCGPFGALLFCRPEQVPAVADAAHESWLRAETAAWFDGPIRTVEAVQLSIGDEDAEG